MDAFIPFLILDLLVLAGALAWSIWTGELTVWPLCVASGVQLIRSNTDGR